MPAATQHQETITYAGKKRRRDDPGQDPSTLPYEAVFRKDTPLGLYPANLDLYSPSEQLLRPDHGFGPFTPPHNAQQPPRKHMPLPKPKRLKETTDEDAAASRPQSRSLSPTAQDHTKSPARELQETDANSRPIPARHASAPALLLSRCHICHRKPTRKADLDSFGDCEGCGQRTCFVCMRECPDWRPEPQKRWSGYGSASLKMEDVDAAVFSQEQGDTDHSLRQLLEERNGGSGAKEGKGAAGKDGWAGGGHRQKICSGCCVERGADGDVVCLGCLPFVEG